jgi:ADP-L-glycero-D-manno-heptose 6-epimerase
MRILVTGYKGFIGQNMIEALTPNHDLVLYEWGDGKVNLDNVDRVIHLGAISSTTCTDVKALKLQNYDFSVKLVLDCITRKIPIQLASSASVYGITNTSFLETDKLAPCNLYAKSKAAIEEFCNRVYGSGVVQVFRYFNVHGPHEEHKGEQASPYYKFSKQLKETGKIKLFKGSDKFYRDFVPVETIIKTHIKFFKIKESGVWNIGTGKPKSFLDVAVEIGGDIEWVDMPDVLKGSYQTYTCANLNKLKTTLNRNG